MFNWIIKKFIGSKNQRTVRRLQPLVAEVNRIEKDLQNESDDALRDRVAAWKDQFRAFHTPKFLGGVSLRVATEEEVDACLRNVNEAFLRLKPLLCLNLLKLKLNDCCDIAVYFNNCG